MSTNEIVWIDGPTDPTFAIIRDNDRSHYFYWPFEITIPHGIKPDDVEPVKVNGRYVLSRYHYYWLTIWCKPLLRDNKPVMYFDHNFHTPIAVVDSDANRRVRERSIDNAPTIRFRHGGHIAFRSLFTLVLQRQTLNFSNPHSYGSKLVKEIGQPVKEKSHLFDADFIRQFIKELIIIGSSEDVNDLISNIQRRGHGRISHDAVIDFFRF